MQFCNRRGNRPNLAVVLMVGVAVFGSHRNACAQVTAAVWDGFGDFAYDVQSMPDLDQKRNGLPGNPDGKAYCIPTSSMNLCAFAANFGFPDFPPFPGVWQGVPGHNEMTGWIDWMGLYMNTNANSGTNGTGKINGMNGWIADSGQPLFAQYYYRNANTGAWPTIDEAALHAVCGAVVQLSYGRYEWSSGFQGDPQLIERDGGHGVTLKLAYADTGNAYGPRLIHYRNPASDDGDPNSNTPFSSNWPDTAANIDVGWDYDEDGDHDTTRVTSLLNPPYVNDDDNRYRLMDSFMALYPGGGMSWDDVVVNAIFVNGSRGFVQHQLPEPFNVQSGETIVAAAPHPQSHSGLALVNGSSGTRLVQVPHAGRSTQLYHFPAGASSLALGFGHTVYVGLDEVATEMVSLDLRGDSPSLGESFPLPGSQGPFDAIAFDADSNQVVAAKENWINLLSVSQSISQRARWSPRLRIVGAGNGPKPIRALATWNGWIIAALTDGGVATARLHSATRDDGSIWFVPLDLPGVRDAMAVDVDSNNRLYVSDRQRGLLEFEYEKRTRQWIPSTNPLYAAHDTRGKRFIPFKNRANVRPGDLKDREWYNIDPDELARLGRDVPD